uniref:Uncharacterized protein n=1 Tax=Spongospora subterranea TaxID=70186 RepID=A0A0H5QU74_9EUKA|eukprot:CRZ05563.1 hypothetical protein [Spongospora subterranea]
MTEQYDSRRFEAIKGDAFSAFPAWHERNPGRTCSLVFPDFAGCVIDFAAPALCHESRFAQLFADQHADCDTLVYLDHTEHDQLPPFRIDYRFEGLVDQGVIRQLSCFYSDSDPKWTKASWLGVDGTVRQVGCVGQYVFPNDPGACPDRQTPLLPAGTPQVIPFLRDTIFADLDATLPSPSTTPLPADFRNLIDELLIVGASAAVRTTCVVGAGHGKEIAALLAISRSTKIVLFEESATTAVELVRERDGLNRIDVNRGPIAETIPKWVDDAHERCDFVVLNQVECGPYQTIDCIDHVAAMELVANAKPGAIVAVNLGYGEAGPFLSGVPSTVQMRTVGCTRGVSYRHMPGPYDHQDTQAHMCFYSI